MQTLLQKFPLKVLIFLSLNTQLVLAQSVEEKLSSADSLFKTQNYTQAFKLYEELYKKEGVYTPQMLIKMAFIKEGMDNYAETLFYLNNYYYLTNDKRAREKMEDLAEQHKLNGYEYSDLKFINNLIRFYQLPITFFFVLILSIFVVWVSYRTFKLKSHPKTEAGFIMFLLIGFLFLNYLIKNYTPAIISETTYVMSGPSAASDVLETIQKGNKVTVLGENDVWMKISDENKKGFIKKDKLLLIKP